MITDDLTGGGDTGIQFADKGLKVVLSIDVDDIKGIPMDAEVWVINTHTRSEPENKAAKKVKKAVEILKNWHARYYYKKIDSTLRGNIGVELEAMMESLRIEKIPLCAAFPDMGRVTVDSTHYVGGKKVSESSYGRDIKSPVKESDINKLLSNQMNNSERIDVKDASTNEDLENLSKEITGNVFAGAAAWAGKLTDRLLSSSRMVHGIILSPGSVLTVSGSLNPISLEQVKYWEQSGKGSIDINESKKNMDVDGDLIVKTSIEETTGSLKKINKIACNLWNTGKWNRVILNGGDTAYGFMKSLGIGQVNVIKSLMTGVALTEYDGKYTVLKPGGYGEAGTLVKLAGLLGGR